jgi:hypothetical protein
MDDMSLKKKIAEWLHLRKAVESLEKAGVHDQHSMAPQGQSVAGHDYQVGKQIRQENRPDHLGFMKAALDSHKRKLDELKQQPKPNLPKTEKAEESSKVKRPAHWQKVRQWRDEKRNPIPKIQEPPFATPPKPILRQVGANKKPVYHRRNHTRHSEIPSRAGGFVETTSPDAEYPVPNKNIRSMLHKADGHEHIVAGVRTPGELMEHNAPVPRDHPHREIAAKFVTDVHRRDKNEGARMSQKYLGIGPEKYISKSVEAIPADVSTPVIQNRVDTSGPRIIDQPNVVNPYKEIFGALKNRKDK